jgi:hypothetical protein
VLQVTCERLFRTAGARKRRGRRQLNREKPWIITLSDLVHLGECDQQIDLYVYETIQEEIQRQLPMLDEIDGAEELEIWKDLLYSMVLIRPDNSAVTVIRSESELQNDPAIKDCRTDFHQMCEALIPKAQSAQIALRPVDTVGKSRLPSWRPEIAAAASNGSQSGLG